MLAGRLADGAATLAPERTYETAEHSIIELFARARALLAPASHFAILRDALHLESGACYVACLTSATEPARLAANGFTLALYDAEAYVRTSGSAKLPPLAALFDLFCPALYAADADSLPALVVVFSGHAELEAAGAAKHTLLPGEFVFIGEDGPRQCQEFLKQVAAAKAEHGRKAADIDARLSPYRRVVATYEARLPQLRKQAAQAAEAEVAELQIRIARIEQVKAAHQARMAQIGTERDAAEASRILDLTARSQVIREALENYREAASRLRGV